jgi:hypothetical protein
MKLVSTLAALLLALPALAAPAAHANEVLVAPDLPGFVVGHSAVNARQSIKEEVPQGETVQNWTRMVTTQRFAGLARSVSPARYAKSILDGLPVACPRATASSVQAIEGQNGVRFKVVCPRTAHGKAESFFLLAIAGRDDMHVKQVAFRGEASSDDFLWARKYLAGVFLCRKKAENPVCN